MQHVLIRVSLKVMVLLSTLLVGVAISSLVVHRKASNAEQPCAKRPTSNSLEPPCSHADYSLLPILSYCDLMAAPQAYENKLVRLRFDYMTQGIGSLRRDDICTEGSPGFQMVLIAGTQDSATEGLMSAWNAELLPRGNVFVVVGRFRKEQTQIRDHSQKYQFELLRIESLVFP